MAELVIPAPERPTVAVDGTAARFPVRRIYCVGRNYDAHVREMGGVPERSTPIFFAKPADAVVESGSTIPYPPGTANFHHEIELVVALKGGGADIAAEQALDLVYGYAAGVDLTRRDLQAAAGKAGQPWESSKGFDKSAPISAIRPATAIRAPQGRIRLAVNGEIRQDARVADLIWKVPEIIAQVSKLWTLAPGDLIFTGTPEGVGPLQRGDRVEGEIEDVGQVAFTIA